MTPKRKRALLVVLMIAVPVLAVTAYGLHRGVRAGASLVTTNTGGVRYVGVQCFYLRWTGVYRKDIDLTNAPDIDPLTNKYCPYLDTPD